MCKIYAQSAYGQGGCSESACDLAAQRAQIARSLGRGRSSLRVSTHPMTIMTHAPPKFATASRWGGRDLLSPHTHLWLSGCLVVKSSWPLLPSHLGPLWSSDRSIYIYICHFKPSRPSRTHILAPPDFQEGDLTLASHGGTNQFDPVRSVDTCGTSCNTQQK